MKPVSFLFLFSIQTKIRSLSLFFLFLEYLVFQTHKQLGGPSLTNSFISIFLEYCGDQNGNDDLDAEFLVPNEEEWLWPIGYTLSPKLILFISARMHSWIRFHLATGTSQTLFVKLVASQYVPSIFRMLHSALLNFIKSLPALLSLIPSEYGIALHPILQVSNEDIKQHQSQYQPLKMTSENLFIFPNLNVTILQIWDQDILWLWCLFKMKIRTQTVNMLFHKKSLITCRGFIHLISNLSLLYQIQIFSVLVNIFSPMRNYNQLFNPLFQEFDVLVFHMPFIGKVQGS